MEKYLEGQEPSEEDIILAFVKGPLTSLYVPVLNGSAFKTKVFSLCLMRWLILCHHRLMLLRLQVLTPKPKKTLCVKARTMSRFPCWRSKLPMTHLLGSLTFARVYSGKLESGQTLVNTVKDKRERIGRMLQMHAHSREEIKSAVAGDIVALVGLKDTTTGDTL